MNSRYAQFLTLITVMGMFFYGCNHPESDGFEIADNGVLYKVHYRGNDTVRPKETDLVTVAMDYRLDDTLLFTSKSLNEAFEFPMIKPMFVGDLYDGLKLMGVGDSMTFKVVADSFFIHTAQLTSLPDFVQAGSPMYFDVKLLDHISQEAFEKNKQDDEDSLIRQYLKENNLIIHPMASGLYFLPLKMGTGQRPDTGDMCRVLLTVKLLDGTQLYSNMDGSNPLDVEFGKGFDTKGFMEGLGMLRVGGRALLIVPSKIGVGNTGKNGVAPYTPVQYEIELARIASVELVKEERRQRIAEQEKEDKRRELDEPSRIRRYVKENNITVAPSGTGLYYMELVKGEGPLAQLGDSVWVHYKLYTIDGKLLESSYEGGNEPFRFPLGSGVVIKAWEEALFQMRKGGRANILTPSSLAYGKRKLRNGIKPYSPLYFELELVDIKK